MLTRIRRNNIFSTLLRFTGFTLLLLIVYGGEQYLAYNWGNGDGDITHPILVTFFNFCYSWILFALLITVFFRKRQKTLLLMSFIAILVINIFVGIAYQQLGRPRIGIDDANIFFVYAKHLAEGKGFVYNRGGERVEGFTSLLWVVIGAFAFRLTKHPEQCLLLCNILFLSGVTVEVMMYLRQFLQHRLHQKEKNTLLYVFAYLPLIFLFPDYLVWMTLTLMDTGLWSFLFVTTALVVLHVPTRSPSQSRMGLSVLIGLLIFTRPEAIVWGLVFIIVAFAQQWHVSDIRTALKFTGIPIITYIVTLALLTTFRLVYFGYPFPNTYYAKVSPSLLYNVQQGIEYWSAYLSAGVLNTLVVCVALLSTWSCGLLLLHGVFHHGIPWTSRRERRRHHVLLGSLCVLGLFLPMAYGGDHFPGFRFYQVIFPLLLMNGLIVAADTRIEQLCALPKGLRYRLVGGAVVMTAIVAWQTSTITWTNVGTAKKSLVGDFRLAEYQRRRGQRLLKFFANLKTYPSVGLNFVGGFKFTYAGEVVDLLGLNNVKMGHSPGNRNGYKNHAAFNKDIFYELRPTLIVLDEDCSDSRQRYKTGLLKGIEYDEKFNNLYRCVEIRKNHAASENTLRRFYATKTFLNQLYATDQYSMTLFIPGSEGNIRSHLMM